MNKISKAILISCFLVVNLLTVCPIVLAYDLGDAFKVRDTRVCGVGADDTLDCAAQKSGYDVSKITGDPKNDTIEPIIATIINILFSLVGVYFVVSTIKAGFDWMTAEGDSKKVETSKDTIKNSVIGIMVVVSAYAIASFIINRFMTGIV